MSSASAATTTPGPPDAGADHPSLDWLDSIREQVKKREEEICGSNYSTAGAGASTAGGATTTHLGGGSAGGGLAAQLHSDASVASLVEAGLMAEKINQKLGTSSYGGQTPGGRTPGGRTPGGLRRTSGGGKITVRQCVPQSGGVAFRGGPAMGEDAGDPRHFLVDGVSATRSTGEGGPPSSLAQVGGSSRGDQKRRLSSPFARGDERTRFGS